MAERDFADTFVAFARGEIGKAEMQKATERLSADIVASADPVTVGKRSVERLVHFNCGKCGGWFSIGDADTARAYCCPWCGKWQKFESA